MAHKQIKGGKKASDDHRLSDDRRSDWIVEDKHEGDKIGGEAWWLFSIRLNFREHILGRRIDKDDQPTRLS